MFSDLTPFGNPTFETKNVKLEKIVVNIMMSNVIFKLGIT